MTALLRKWLVPERVYLPFVILGALCWLLPADILGLYRKSEVTVGGVVVIAAWYGLIFYACRMAHFSVARVQLLDVNRQAQDPLFYYFMTALAFVGTVGVLSRVGSYDQVVNLIGDRQVNELKSRIYSDYNAGLLTLRYTSAITGAIAIYNIIVRRRIGIIDIVNIVCLLVCAFISARILIFQSLIFFIFVAVNEDRVKLRWKLSKLQTILLVFAAASLIVTFTYVRSAGTYKQELGLTNPVAVTVVEIARYSGMPIQVTIGVSDLIVSTPIVQARQFRPIYLAPAFFYPPDIEGDNSGGVGKQWYLGKIDIPPTLTTNSAFAATVGYLGHWAFLFIPLVCYLYAALFWIMRSLGSFEGKLFQGVILYAFFELWRVYFFSGGAFIYFMLLFTLYFSIRIAMGTVKIALRVRQIGHTRRHSYEFQPPARRRINASRSIR